MTTHLIKNIYSLKEILTHVDKILASNASIERDAIIFNNKQNDGQLNLHVQTMNVEDYVILDYLLTV